MITFSKPMYWGEQNCIQPTDIADTGYIPGDNPAAEHENYFRRQTYLCLKELQSTVSVLNEYMSIIMPYIAIDAGMCGENTEYSLCLDNTLRIAGTGSIDEKAFEHREDFGALDVNITGKIGVWAFAGCSHLSLAEVNCNEIGDGAFTGCQQLKWLTIGKSVQKIGAEILRQVGSLYDSSVRVMYDGTMAEWAAVEKSANWVGEMVTVENGVVICTDGTVEV